MGSHRSWLLLTALVTGAVAAGCSSNSTVATGPTQLKCQVTLAAPASSFGPEGGAGSITVTTSPECPWDVSTGATWLSGLSPASGQGNGAVEFRAAPNPVPSGREADIVVNDNRLRVSQQAAACQLVLGSNSLTIDAGGGTREVTVSAPSGCSWTAAADANWIAFTTPVTGSGDGRVGVSLAPHDGDAPRVGTIAVGDQRITVTQESDAPVPTPVPGCVYSISSTSEGVLPSDGASVSASVTVAGGCAWTASSSVAWVTVVAGSAGTGSGAVTFSVAVNPGGVRTGNVTVAGQRFTLTQAAATTPNPSPCTYTLSAPDIAIPAPGGTGTVAVSAGGGCAWTASSTAAWVTVTSGASGAGTGAIAFTVASNPGAARSASINVAGQTFTVNQAAAAAPAPCTYAISPPAASLAAAGGSGTVAVTARDGCSWTASSSANWIIVTSGASGAGNGAVAFSVAPNPGAARSGSISIAGQTFTVNQSAAPAPCTYTLGSTTATIGLLGGTGTVTVTARDGCTWTADSNANWITVTAGASGSGNGSVGFSVAANLIGARTGTITVAGQTFTVTQSALLSSPGNN